MNQRDAGPEASEGGPTSVQITELDTGDPVLVAGYLALMDHYAAGTTGSGAPLDAAVRQRLVPALRERDITVFLAVATRGVEREVVGLATCLESFSTFQAAPVFNLHDLVVHESHRRRGIGHRLLSAFEERARAKGCCKLTLEVLAGNVDAKRLYRGFGFDGYALAPDMGSALFFEKKL